MFERFTDEARRVLVVAEEEARLLANDHVGTEHILLGLVGETEGVAYRVLVALGVSPEDARQEVAQVVAQDERASVDHIPFTPEAKTVLTLSLREALNLGHGYIGTEHILLGLLREGRGLGAEVLERRGCDLEGLRTRVVDTLNEHGGEE